MADWWPSYANAYNQMGGLGAGGAPSDWASQGAPAQGAPAQGAQTDGGDPNAMAGAVGAQGLGGLFGGLSQGGGAGAGTPGGAPGWQQGMIGLGLGLLSGNPFNKWGNAMRGYQTGAAADVARQQQVNQWANQQAQLAISRGHLGVEQEHLRLQRELAFKPQVHFTEEEDPSTGYKRARAFLAYPQSGKIQEVPLDTADKLATQGNVGVSLWNPITQERVTLPLGSNVKKIRDAWSQTQADVVSGKITPQEAKANQFADRMQMAEDQLRKDDLDREGFSKGARFLSNFPEWSQPFVQSQRYTDYSSAKDAFITGVARNEGARLSPQQTQAYDRAYFPQPGESPEIIEQKRQMRQMAIDNMRKAESPAARARAAMQSSEGRRGEAEIPIGTRKQFKQGWGVWNGTKYVPEGT